MSIYKLIIFDMDDTLFDYVATEKLAIEGACHVQNVSFSDDAYLIYKKANDIAKKVLPNFIFDLPKFRKLRAVNFFELMAYKNMDEEKFNEDYLRISSQNGVLINGVLETITHISMHSRAALVVATNGSDYPRKNKLFSSPIAPYIARYYSSERMKVAKPDAAFFGNIMKDYDVYSHEVINIGDDWSTDVMCAINAGISCCWFNWKNQHIDKQIPENIQIVTKFGDIEELTK